MGCSGSSARHVLTSDTASIRLFLRVPYRSIGMHSLCTAIFLSPAFLATPNSTVPHSSRPLLDRSTLLSECTSFPGVLPRYKVLPSFLTPRLSVYSADSISAPPRGVLSSLRYFGKPHALLPTDRPPVWFWVFGTWPVASCRSLN